VLDNTNITLFTGARSIYALGRDFPALRILDRWDTVRGVPVAGVLVQGAVALVIALVAAYTRRGLETVVDFLQPVFWTFFLLTGLALFMLRRGAPDAPRPFRVPFYPVLPALFCIMAAAMLWSAVAFTGRGALVGVGVLLLGLPVLLILRRFPSPSLT
jgi:APA family basic amino acid/polyamine antiporter